MEDVDIEQRLRAAAMGIRDDIRGLFRGHPDYVAYLVEILGDAREEIKELRQRIPAPPPED